jgi:hypothetical protein
MNYVSSSRDDLLLAAEVCNIKVQLLVKKLSDDSEPILRMLYRCESHQFG